MGVIGENLLRKLVAPGQRGCQSRCADALADIAREVHQSGCRIILPAIRCTGERDGDKQECERHRLQTQHAGDMKANK